ncbi:MAG: nucleotidyltransferase domain-containing protein [Syntrophobacteraceae bacterium]|jgi:predicted nucleotidyltransferase
MAEMKPPGLKEIEAILRERRDELTIHYGVTEIGIFGSFVRGDASSDSDIDILVSFNRPWGFSNSWNLKSVWVSG